MEKNLTAKMIDEMLPTQKAELIGQMIREGKRSKVEETCAISSRNVARYNRINYLIPSIQKLVDEYTLPLLSAVALSFRLAQRARRSLFSLKRILEDCGLQRDIT